MQWINFDNLQGVRPNGYRLRLPFYLQGTQNAHIVVSTKENPTAWEPAYELIIGGLRNTRLVLRKRVNGAVLADVFWPNILSQFQKKKFVLEITQSGHIHLYSEDFPYQPILKAFDVIPEDWTFNYLSFKNSLNEKLYFYYGNPVEVNFQTVVNQLLVEKYKEVTLNPLFQDWKLIQREIDIKLLTQHSKYFETWEPSYQKYIAIPDNYRPTGYNLRTGFYVQSPRHIRILLSTSQNPATETDFDYEIHIGRDSNTAHTILKNGEEIARVYEQNILSQWKPVKLVLEATADGLLQVFTSYNPYVPLISVKDPQPIAIKYISFASASRSQFFYETQETVIAKLPFKPVSPITSWEVTQLHIKHPLLNIIDWPVGLSDLCK